VYVLGKERSAHGAESSQKEATRFHSGFTHNVSQHRVGRGDKKELLITDIYWSAGGWKNDKDSKGLPVLREPVQCIFRNTELFGEAENLQVKRMTEWKDGNYLYAQRKFS
jgi:hypothetical protein